jgi:hypothetical protein
MVNLPDSPLSTGNVERVSRVPWLIGQVTVVQRSSTVGFRGMKLYVDVYVAVPLLIISGIFIDRRRVEF